jgi:hypothetical protein
MPKIIRYDSATCELFDGKTQTILDSIQQHFPIVEIQIPEGGKSNQWFVQTFRQGREGPEGFFGQTTFEAACRLAKALKVPI